MLGVCNLIELANMMKALGMLIKTSDFSKISDGFP